MMLPIYFIIGLAIGGFFSSINNNIKHGNEFDPFEKVSDIIFLLYFCALIILAILNIINPSSSVFSLEDIVTNSITLMLGFFTFRLGAEAKKDREERIFSEATRLHSVKLNELSLIKWKDKIDQILVMGYMYSYEEEEIIPKNLGEFNIIPHSDFLKSHMESGYPQVWSKWCSLIEETENYNEFLASFAEELRENIHEKSEELGHQFHYQKAERAAPLEYDLPLLIVEKMLLELEYRLKGVEGIWTAVNLRLDAQTKLSLLYHTVVMGGTIVSVNREYDEVVKIQYFINDLSNEDEVIKNAREINMLKDKIDQLKKEFISEIRNINSRIELGENIKGICEVCPK